jgi:outer membrane murein-binding lipoprotein Lpp
MRRNKAVHQIIDDQIEEEPMEARIARIEADVANLKENVADIKTDVRGLRDDMKAANESIARVDKQVASLEAKMDGKLSALEAKMDGGFAAAKAETQALVSAVQGQIDKLGVKLIMWLVATVIGTAGIAIGYLRAYPQKPPSEDVVATMAGRSDMAERSVDRPISASHEATETPGVAD